MAIVAAGDSPVAPIHQWQRVLDSILPLGREQCEPAGRHKRLSTITTVASGDVTHKAEISLKIGENPPLFLRATAQCAVQHERRRTPRLFDDDDVSRLCREYHFVKSCPCCCRLTNCCSTLTSQQSANDTASASLHPFSALRSRDKQLIGRALLLNQTHSVVSLSLRAARNCLVRHRRAAGRKSWHCVAVTAVVVVVAFGLRSVLVS